MKGIHFFKEKPSSLIEWFYYTKDLLLLLIAILTFLSVYFGIQLKINKFRTDIARIEQLSLQNNFKILNIHENDSVMMNKIIKIRSPYINLYHYVLVTPEGLTCGYIQNDPIKPSSNGLITQSARIGDIQTSKGTSFIIQGIATTAKLQKGIINGIPIDALFTDPIVIIRK